MFDDSCGVISNPNNHRTLTVWNGEEDQGAGDQGIDMQRNG
jgi:hypothetical protein